jgi:hypothetical protein
MSGKEKGLLTESVGAGLGGLALDTDDDGFAPPLSLRLRGGGSLRRGPRPPSPPPAGKAKVGLVGSLAVRTNENKLGALRFVLIHLYTPTWMDILALDRARKKKNKLRHGGHRVALSRRLRLRLPLSIPLAALQNPS